MKPILLPRPSNAHEEIFGPATYVYSRTQALADGTQVSVASVIAREAGFTVPVFLTGSVYSTYVRIPAGVEGQDVEGRLWDVLWMLRAGLKASKVTGRRINFQLYVRNTNGRPRLVTLAAEMGPRDVDDPSPALTVMLPSED